MYAWYMPIPSIDRARLAVSAVVLLAALRHVIGVVHRRTIAPAQRVAPVGLQYVSQAPVFAGAPARDTSKLSLAVPPRRRSRSLWQSRLRITLIMPATHPMTSVSMSQHKCMLSAANQPIQLHCMRLSGPIRVRPVAPESIRRTSVTDSPPIPVAKHDFVLSSPVWAGGHCADHVKIIKYCDFWYPPPNGDI